ncbi:MAG: hypothetical protein HXY52_02410 [Nitrospirae bacterium]|jgi:signal recognition particle receptor subunit beta|nr:hypothetical protein [Nitrospirota bacterium]
MALFNYATKEITIKIVYYGPGLSGKTTNLQYLHSIFDPSRRGKLLSLATEADRTLFFDFLPVEIGKISDFSIRFQLYTVPGQVRYNATRKIVLKGADAVVFVADSQKEMRDSNIESLKNMYENLIENNINPDEISIVLQFNKRDLSNILSVDELNKDLNPEGKYNYFESIAVKGEGVEKTFREITKLVIKNISQKHKIKIQTSEEYSENLSRPEKAVPEKTFSKSPIFEELEPKTTIKPISAEEEIPIQRTSFEMPEIEIPEVRSEQENIITKIEEKISKPVIKEIPVISDRKADEIIKIISETNNILKELKTDVENIKKELKDNKKEQKEINSLIRTIYGIVENLKEKKSWFRFFGS